MVCTCKIIFMTLYEMHTVQKQIHIKAMEDCINMKLKFKFLILIAMALLIFFTVTIGFFSQTEA